MWTSAFFGAKNCGFFEIYRVSEGQGGLSQHGHLIVHLLFKKAFILE